MKTGYGGVIPTAERVREVLDYDPSTGIFTWKVKKAYRVEIGDVAGTMNSCGYRMLRIDNRAHFAHRIAWLLISGEWPTSYGIDHINRDPADNRAVNLRRATQSQNLCNREMKPGGSGFCGVWEDRRNGCNSRWTAMLSQGDKRRWLGSFSSAEAAARAWDRAVISERGEFAKTNFPKEQYA